MCRLTNQQIRLFIRSILGAVSDRLVDRIAERTDGVPLFVEELTRSILESGADANEDIEIPDSLQGSLMARLDRLSATSREVAQVAAVIGRGFDRDLLAQVAALVAPILDDALRQLFKPGEASPQLLPEAKNGVRQDDVGRHAPTAAPRDGSKLALLIDLLRRADGATIVDLTQTTGWLAHTTRAAITGLRKRGYAVTRERMGAGESVYRISGAPAGSGDRVAVQTEAVDGRRDPKPRTKRAA